MKDTTASLRQLLEQPGGQSRLLRELLNDPDLNVQLLKLAMHARGYNNFQNGLVSGELFLIQKVLPQLGIRTCLDVGAAQGEYSRLLLQSLPDCQVYGCEPLSLNLPILEALAREEPLRFHLWPWALGDQEEQAWLRYNPAVLQHASLCDNLDSIDYLDNHQCERVSVRRLDAIWPTLARAEPLDFIKIDSEGWEANVLDGYHWRNDWRIMPCFSYCPIAWSGGIRLQSWPTFLNSPISSSSVPISSKRSTPLQ
jgi:FkbM family methyltransferase